MTGNSETTRAVGWCATALGALLILLVGEAPAESRLDLTLAPYYATRIEGGGDRTTGEGITLLARLEERQGPVLISAEGRYRYNGVFDRRPNAYSEAAEREYEQQFDWRELFISVQGNAWNLAAGLQQVVWGKADNLRVLDQVNPVDLQAFYLPDLGEYRKAIPMLRLQGPLGDWEADVVWLPVFEPNDYATAGSEFFTPLFAEPTLPEVTTRPARKPAATLGNSELGMRLTTTRGDLDLALVAFYTRADDPVFKSVQTAEGTELRGYYPRQWLLGAGMATPLEGGLVARGELALVPDASYAGNSADGIERAATVTLLLGLDYSYRDWSFSGQLQERFIEGWHAGLAVPERSPIVTISAEGNHWDARLKSEFRYTTLPLHGDGSLYQLRATYRWDDHWASTAALDFLEGEADGLFGQFADRDRMVLELRYQF